MKAHVSAIVIAALLCSVPAHAATDMGLTLHNGLALRGRAVGAQAGVTIKLGDRRVMRESEKVTLGIQAGPVFSVRDRSSVNGERRMVGNMLSLTLKPGYATSLSIGGQSLAAEYTSLGAAEADDEGKPKKKQGTGDKIAWVAAVAGGVMVILIGATVIAFATQGPTD